MAKKFGSITSIHKVFNSVEDLQNSIFNLPEEHADGVDANSIIYFIADDTDVSIFSSLQIISGVEYIWQNGKLFGQNYVYTIGNQNIQGNKIFTGQISFSKDPNFPITTFHPEHLFIDDEWPDSPGIYQDNIYKACFCISDEANSLDEGSYMVQIKRSTDTDGGIYTGCFSYANVANVDEEIFLHRSGNYDSTERLYAKIKNYASYGIYLVLSANVKELDCTELTIKIRKLI